MRNSLNFFMQKNWLYIIIGVIILFLGFSWYAKASLNKAVAQSYSQDKTQANFSVNPGENIGIIAKNLEKQKLIKSANIITRYAKKTKNDTKIKAGDYTLSPAMTTKEILELLVSGQRQEVWFTVPEGLRIDQIATKLEKEGIGKAKEFEARAYVKNFSSKPFLVGLGGNTTLEGYLFPDTYKFYANATVDDIIAKMLDNFGDKVTRDIMDRANKMGFSLHRFITLVSIVEKESAHSADIAKISSVYHNRLKQKMLLQSDATITYITRRPDASPTIDETKAESAYNTYLYQGLPPGPVGNPGLGAISATLNPDQTDYLFFVSDQKDGKSYFAKTYDEHLNNIEKYLR